MTDRRSVLATPQHTHTYTHKREMTKMNLQEGKRQEIYKSK